MGRLLRALSEWPALQAVRRWLVLHKWTLIGFVWAVALALGALGFWQHAGRPRSPAAILDILYLTAQLFVLQSGAVDSPIPLALQAARFLAPAIATVTVLQAIGAIFAEQWEFFRLRRMHDHLVICGLGWVGWLLVREQARNGQSVVVIEKHAGNALIKDCRGNGAIVLLGDASEEFALRRGRLERAKYLVAATGVDGQNVQIALTARRLLQGQKHHLDCYVHIVDRQLCALLAAQEIERETPSEVHIEFFNIFESGARVLLDTHPLPEPCDDSDVPAPVLIAGFADLGAALLVELGYRRWRDHRGSGPLRVWVAGRDVEERLASLQAIYPCLADYCSVSAVELRRGSRRRHPFRQRQTLQGFSIAYICGTGDSDVLSVALDLYERRTRERQPHVPIVACLSRREGLAELIETAGSCTGQYVDVRAFGLLDEISTPEKLLIGAPEVLARSLRSNEASAAGTSDWGRLTERAREPYRRRARAMFGRLSSIDCHISPLRDWSAPTAQLSEEDLETLMRGRTDPRERAALSSLDRILGDEGLALYRCPRP